MAFQTARDREVHLESEGGAQRVVRKFTSLVFHTLLLCSKHLHQNLRKQTGVQFPFSSGGNLGSERVSWKGLRLVSLTWAKFISLDEEDPVG
jgi:hypothetical protein